MNVQINSLNMQHSSALRDHVVAQLERSLRSVRDRITRIVVRFHDDNGPRGGTDKRCTVEVRLAGVEPLLAEQRHADVFRAAAGAVTRVRRAVRRRIERNRTF